MEFDIFTAEHAEIAENSEWIPLVSKVFLLGAEGS